MKLGWQCARWPNETSPVNCKEVHTRHKAAEAGEGVSKGVQQLGVIDIVWVRVSCPCPCVCLGCSNATQRCDVNVLGLKKLHFTQFMCKFLQWFKRKVGEEATPLGGSIQCSHWKCHYNRALIDSNRRGRTVQPLLFNLSRTGNSFDLAQQKFCDLASFSGIWIVLQFYSFVWSVYFSSSVGTKSGPEKCPQISASNASIWQLDVIQISRQHNASPKSHTRTYTHTCTHTETPI